MKAMSTALIVTMSAVVILVVAVVVLAIFLGGIQNVGTTICNWLGGCGSEANPCKSSCNAWRLTNCQAAQPGGTGQTKSISCVSLPGCDKAGSVCDCGSNVCG